MSAEGPIASVSSLNRDLRDLGVQPGDGVFVHASLRAIGPVVGSARAVIQALLNSVGSQGLIGMPGFSADACFPADVDRDQMDDQTVELIEGAVLGYDPLTSPTDGMGTIAEAFRTWPGTLRSNHPTASICLNGLDADRYGAEHSLAWATGPDTPLGRLRERRPMKVLLVGVGWNRCSALHTAETLADVKRVKVRRFKSGNGDAPWLDTPDVADDLNRLFPAVGAAFENTGAVQLGRLGDAACRIAEFSPLVDFATAWICDANKASGDRH